MQNLNPVIIENKHFVLTVGADCIAKSLILKANGEECLMPGEETALFSLTEDRPYNNEIKLAHPNKRTTFEANRVRREGERLIVGFELVTFEAVVTIRETDGYVAFELTEFLVNPEDFGDLCMTPPPVAEFRLLQLPVKNRERFGEWLNVAWDDTAAVNVLSTCPFTRIDSQKRRDCRILYADCLRDTKLKNCGAALIACQPAALFDCIDALERDFDLPRGVESRRSGVTLNSSAYWTADINPGNVDEHIAYALKGGFRMMLIYYTAFFKEERGYRYCGDYDFNDYFPGGVDDLRAMLDKIKAAGITPGIHFLQTHIGIESRYVTPVADHRLNLTKHFTLARPLSETDDVVYVEQNPEGTQMHPKRRVLKFGGELIEYESFTTRWPYCFTGCKRGHFGTTVKSHDPGTIGGLLDISEYGATSVYIDQRTSLQDEVAAKLARVYNAGFSFIYYDGSEGAVAPYEIYVPYAQYRVYRQLDKKPLFCEGAAKAHFSWHMLSGGNAFDVFPTSIFKKMIARFPLEEAPRMANDLTRLNFGWWAYFQDTQPDVYEYGTSKAASWDCPATVQTNMALFKSNPRTDDNFEVMRRWEDVRARDWLTKEQKELLRDPDAEYTLLINEEGAYELVRYYPIESASPVAAFWFEREGRAYVVYWHTEGEGKLALSLNAADVTCEVQLGGEAAAVETTADGIVVPVAGKRYLSTTLAKEELIRAFENAQIVE